MRSIVFYILIAFYLALSACVAQHAVAADPDPNTTKAAEALRQWTRTMVRAMPHGAPPRASIAARPDCAALVIITESARRHPLPPHCARI